MHGVVMPGIHNIKGSSDEKNFSLDENPYLLLPALGIEPSTSRLGASLLQDPPSLSTQLLSPFLLQNSHLQFVKRKLHKMMDDETCEVCEFRQYT